jgi:hypothetical protein
MAVPRRLQRDVAARGRVGQRVADDVVEHLGDTNPIRLDRDGGHHPSVSSIDRADEATRCRSRASAQAAQVVRERGGETTRRHLNVPANLPLEIEVTGPLRDE